MSETNKQTDTPETRVGLCCRRCGQRQFRVLYTRPRPGGIVFRRRECRQCGTRITTREREIGA
jgi:transcriptional regulator NrdR family protein